MYSLSLLLSLQLILDHQGEGGPVEVVNTLGGHLLVNVKIGGLECNFESEEENKDVDESHDDVHRLEWKAKQITET